MVDTLEKIVTDFSMQIKDKFADYVALYASFIEYIREEYSEYGYPVEEFLNHDFSRKDIIKSCIRYIENSTKVNSVAAIDKYLNAMTKLYEECIKKQGYNNRNLFAILPFGSLKSEVKEKLKDIELKEKQPIKPISVDDAENLICSLRELNKRDNIIAQRNRIIIKLILLYGFKLERLKYMIVKDVNINQHTLNIENDTYGGISIKIELPYNLVLELESYINELEKETDYSANQYLFLSRNKKVIDSSIMDNEKFKGITLTGVAKYAIINMIKEGINKVNIKLITGMQDNIVDDCERCFLEQQFHEKANTVILNREINKKIRGIEMYDKI